MKHTCFLTIFVCISQCGVSDTVVYHYHYAQTLIRFWLQGKTGLGMWMNCLVLLGGGRGEEGGVEVLLDMPGTEREGPKSLL